MNEVVPEARFYFAASSEIFGQVYEVPQTEKSPFHPRSVYGISKSAGFDLTRNYREVYVICTGKNHSVREFREKAFSFAGLDYKKYIAVNKKFFRPAEVEVLVGDYSKAKNILNWMPTISLDELIAEMVENDLEYLSNRR